ncbi:MAG TPA: DUF3014 domain-containing protein, partial [Burkholderiaceae bacterium]|nr:DUF3014 domain-containing protein [Burkholderiaceae bacterium]
MKRTSIAAIAALLLTVVGIGGLYWYQHRAAPAPERAEALPVAEVPPQPPASTPSAPAIRNPVDTSLAEAA